MQTQKHNNIPDPGPAVRWSSFNVAATTLVLAIG
jgi:hypothetical protein